jgi:hypothetical protein
MAIAQASSRGASALPGRLRPAHAGYAALALLVVGWTFRALHDPAAWDTGLAYGAGRVAWATGHPEHVISWISTPFLGMVMAVASRLLSVRAVADLVTLLNMVLWVAAAGLLLRRTRPLLSPVWWWIAAFGLFSFLPMMSSVWFKQFNVIALVLAAGGFELVRRGRVSWGALAIGLSIAIKPLVVLLPVVMLVRRDTRRAGVLALAWVVGLNVAAQAFMALRAHDLGTLDPWIGARNFLDKTRPNFAMCMPLNVSPISALCRAGAGLQDWNVLRAVSLGGVLLLGAWVVRALRGRAATSWEVFAFACPLSAMVSPLEWTHYQILLAPLFVLLLVRFAREGASFGAWAGLLAAFVLASLIWQPYGSIVSAAKGIFSPQAQHEPTTLEALAQFAQYILILTGVLWYMQRRRAPGRPLQL